MGKVVVITAFLMSLSTLHAEVYKGFEDALIRWDELRGAPSMRIYVLEPDPTSACLLPILHRPRINVGGLPGCTDIDSAKKINDWYRERKIQQWLQPTEIENKRAIEAYPFWEDLEIFNLNDFGPGLNEGILRPEPPRCLAIPKG